VGGGVRDEDAGVPAEDELGHIVGEAELAEHLGLEVEDLGGVVEEEEGVVEQDLPQLLPLDAPALQPLHQQAQLLPSRQEHLAHLPQQPNNPLPRQHSLLPLHQEAHALAEAFAGAAEEEGLVEEDLERFCRGEVEVVGEYLQLLLVLLVELVVDEVGRLAQQPRRALLNHHRPTSSIPVALTFAMNSRICCSLIDASRCLLSNSSSFSSPAMGSFCYN
jgi:hypothetical protein